LELHPHDNLDDLHPARKDGADPPADLGEFDPEVSRGEPLLSTTPAYAGRLSLADEWTGVAATSEMPPLPLDDAPLAADPPLTVAGPSFAREADGPRGWVALFAFLAMAAGAVALAIVLWSTMSSRIPPSPAPSVAATSSAIAEGRAPESVVPERAVPERPVRAPDPVQPMPDPPETPAAVAVGAAAPRAVAAPSAAASASSSPRELPDGTRAAIDEALDTYRRSFNARDAVSVAGLEGADATALQTAFADRRYQSMTFDKCAVRVMDANAAVATCDGAISEVLASDPSLRRRSASWTIALRRTAPTHWAIERVSAR
jgi:hypothetical protein